MNQSLGIEKIQKKPLSTSINFGPEIYLILYRYLGNLTTHIALPVVI
jgi:hypothetical protein